MKAILVPSWLACGYCHWPMGFLSVGCQIGSLTKSAEVACSNKDCTEFCVRYKNPLQFVELVKSSQAVGGNN